jgi:hypothetical protein
LYPVDPGEPPRNQIPQFAIATYALRDESITLLESDHGGDLRGAGSAARASFRSGRPLLFS